MRDLNSQGCLTLTFEQMTAGLHLQSRQTYNSQGQRLTQLCSYVSEQCGHRKLHPVLSEHILFGE